MKLQCIKKVNEIPLVNVATTSVNKIYENVKAKNFVSKLGFSVFEKSATVMAQGVFWLAGGPLGIVDSVACVVIDEIRVKFPVVSKTPEELGDSGKSAILKNPVVKLAVKSTDRILSIVEAMITLIPSVKAQYLHEKRGSLQSLYMNSCSTPIKSDSRRTATPKRRLSRSSGLFSIIFSAPRYLLRVVGKMACYYRYEELKFAEELLEDASPNKMAISSEEKKRKTPEYESEEELTIHDLVGNSFSEYKSEDDEDYNPENDAESTDSLEYNSGSAVHDTSAFDNIEEIPTDKTDTRNGDDCDNGITNEQNQIICNHDYTSTVTEV